MLNIVPPQPRPRRHLAEGEIVAWGIILVVVGVIFVVPFIRRSQIRANSAADAYLHPTVDILMSGRYAIGAKALVTDPTHPSTRMLKSVQDAAKNQPDLLRAAIVTGEFEDAKSALTELDRLDKLYPELHADIQTLRLIYQGWFSPTGLPEWQGFRDRHGWFADLAESFHKPDSDPLRVATFNAGLRTLLAILGIALVVFLALLLGIVLFIFALVFLIQKKIPLAFSTNSNLPPDRRAYLEAFAWYMGLYLGLAVIIHYVLKLDGPLGNLSLLFAFAVAMSWPIIQGQTWSQFSAALGLHKGKGVFHEIWAGFLGYIAGLPVYAVGAILTIILTKLTGANTSHPIIQEVGSGSMSWLLLFLLASVWAPITEEILFRGAFFSHLRERFGFWLSAIPVSLVFAMIHPQGWAGVPALASLALILAAIREWRGSIIASMTAHALHNTTLSLFLLLAIT